jgi:hypothetical protein
MTMQVSFADVCANLTHAGVVVKGLVVFVNDEEACLTAHDRERPADKIAAFFAEKKSMR